MADKQQITCRGRTEYFRTYVLIPQKLFNEGKTGFAYKNNVKTLRCMKKAAMKLLLCYTTQMQMIA